MISRIVALLLLVMLFLSACGRKKPFAFNTAIRESSFTGTVVIEKIEKLDKYRISIFDSITGKTDRIYTPYEIFQANIADANNDGKSDICIGIIKPTPFDPVLKKRLFIFQIDQDYIRPLWLGSRLAYPLEEFTTIIINNKCIIQTIEKQSNIEYCVNQYKWGSFGMVYVQQIASALTYNEAKQLLKK